MKLCNYDNLEWIDHTIQKLVIDENKQFHRFAIGEGYMILYVWFSIWYGKRYWLFTYRVYKTEGILNFIFISHLLLYTQSIF